MSPNIIKKENNLQGEDIYFFKELKIPNPKEYNSREMDNDYVARQQKIDFLIQYVLEGDDKCR